MGEDPKQQLPRNIEDTQAQPHTKAVISNFSQNPNIPTPPQPQPVNQPVDSGQITFHNSQAPKSAPTKFIVITAILVIFAALVFGGYKWYSKQVQYSDQHTNRANSVSNQSSNSVTSNPTTPPGAAESVPSGTDNPSNAINSNPGLKSSVDYCKNNPLTC